jgi:isoquinoline 1-oxidoreductase subunit beta
MKYAVLVRPPVVGGKLVSFDAKDALAVPGVEQVIEAQGWPWPSKFQPLGGLAVIARNTGAAIKGRDALKVAWDDGANDKYDSEAYRAELEESVRKPGLVVRNEGDVDAALKSADKVIVGEYYLPHLAHSMEPPAAIAHVTDTTAEIWAPVQSPGGTHDDIAKTLGLKPDAVTVHVTLLGGGFGRKSKCDYAIEAALLSRKLKAPVRVQWTRADDIHHDFSHTVSAERIEAGIDKAGTVIAWRHRSAAPSFMSSSWRARKTSRRSSSGRDLSTYRLRSQTYAARIRKQPRIRGSAGSARSRIFHMHSRSRRWLPKSRTRSAAIPRTCSSS